jgi:amidase
VHNLEITQLATLLASRALSPVEVTRATLARIEALDPQLRAFSVVTPDLALEEARMAEREILAHGPRSILHGVPLAVKDVFWTKGVVTAAGSTIHRGFTPSEDATVVRKLKEAGAVILGKLQLTEGAFAMNHPDIPPPVNPWGADHWPGASSHGAGVAVSAGLCFGAVATDTGGSIRFPCAANGVTGIKPTWGRVSRHGMIELAASLDHVGPMARSVADVAALLAVIAGADPLDPVTMLEMSGERFQGDDSIAGFRIGIDNVWNSSHSDIEVVTAMERAISDLVSLGGEVVEIQMPDPSTVVEEFEIICAPETAAAHRLTYPFRKTEYGPALSRLIDLGRNIEVATYQRALRNRAEFRVRVELLLRDLDVLAVPVQPFASPTYERLAALAQDIELNRRMTQFTVPFNLSGHPTIVCPCGFTGGGMPLALQLVARHGGEASLFRAGHAFQAATDWHKRRPIS